ncbi:MAG: hypothetical protein HY914_08040 [Desulfomonile tiedjei]|nr:hypothetical protein [Desulfomonile tiedjei]
MRYAVAITVVFLFLAACPAWGDAATEACTEQIGAAVEAFMAEVFRTARVEKDLSEQDRQKRHAAATEKLVTSVRQLRVETAPLLALIKQYIEREEARRSPPPGWDPDDREGNLAMFSEMAQQAVRIDLELVSYGRKFCPSRNP